MQLGGSAPPSAGKDRADPAASALARYFGDIGELSVLTRAEEREIASRFRAHRTRVHALLGGLPATGAALCERWRSHQGRANPFQGLLARSTPANPEGTTRDVDRTVRRIQRRLNRTPPIRSRGPADEAAWDRFESLQRRDLLALDLSADFYQEVEQFLRQVLAELNAAANDAARGRARDAVGLPLRRFRRLMRALEPVATARDEVRNELARHNLKLVVRFAKDFRNLGVGFSDLIQEGNLGLLRAVELFEPERGLKFSTYAVWWIRQSLVRAVQKHSRTVRLPSHINDRLYQMGRASDQLSGRLGRSPTDRELARETGLEAGRVEHLRSLQKMPLSLDQATDPQGSRLLHEVLPDPQVASPLDRLDGVRDQKAVGALLTRLDERERAVIGRRFGFSGEDRVTLEGVARDLGLSRERVRQIERHALSKLRGWAEGARANGGTNP
ncbi:MAG: RNA polymerase sigma factor RpoD/SigA [Planctomycetota bacterium]